jgi:hypothetical protein
LIINTLMIVMVKRKQNCKAKKVRLIWLRQTERDNNFLLHRFVTLVFFLYFCT